METARTIYLGDLRTQMTHLRSGEVITTDAPPDNQGKGEYFSPTDLVATALSGCMLTIMGMAARTHNFNMDGAEAVVTKIMSADPPRRISRVIIDLRFPRDYPQKIKTIIEKITKTCPVALSLHPDIEQEVNTYYGQMPEVKGEMERKGL